MPRTPRSTKRARSPATAVKKDKNAAVAVPAAKPAVAVPVSKPEVAVPVSKPEVAVPVSKPAVAVPATKPEVIVLPLSKPAIQRKKREAHPILELPQEYSVRVHLGDYNPEDIQIKAERRDGTNWLAIEARCEESEEESQTTRSFARRYSVPAHIDVEKFTSKLDKNGVLVVQAPAKLAENKATERVVHIRNVPCTSEESGEWLDL